MELTSTRPEIVTKMFKVILIDFENIKIYVVTWGGS